MSSMNSTLGMIEWQFWLYYVERLNANERPPIAVCVARIINGKLKKSKLVLPRRGGPNETERIMLEIEEQIDLLDANAVTLIYPVRTASGKTGLRLYTETRNGDKCAATDEYEVVDGHIRVGTAPVMEPVEDDKYAGVFAGRHKQKQKAHPRRTPVQEVTVLNGSDRTDIHNALRCTAALCQTVRDCKKPTKQEAVAYYHACRRLDELIALHGLERVVEVGHEFNLHLRDTLVFGVEPWPKAPCPPLVEPPALEAPLITAPFIISEQTPPLR